MDNCYNKRKISKINLDMARDTSKLVTIPGELHSAATGNIVAAAEEVFDYTTNKYQKDINQEVAYIKEDSSVDPIPSFNPQSQTVHLDEQVLSNAQKKQVRKNIGLGNGDIDSTPTSGSDNVVRSGGVYSSMQELRSTVNPQVGYYTCSTAGDTAAKVIDVSGYTLLKGGGLRVNFTEKNTAANATLNIEQTGAKPLYYNGVRVSTNNSWYAGEIMTLFYDGAAFQLNSLPDLDEYDVSARNGGQAFTFEEAVALVPEAYRHGGLKLRFISNSDSGQSSDNRYVQYRLMATAWSNIIADWQGVDNEPTAGSNNLVKSGGVAEKLSELDKTINGKERIVLSLEKGYYEDEGYKGQTDARFYHLQKCSPGVYSIYNVSGFKWELYYYVSDSEGTKYYGLTSLNRENVILSNNFIITIMKLDNSILTDDDLNLLRANFLVEKIYDNGLVKEVASIKEDLEENVSQLNGRIDVNKSNISEINTKFNSLNSQVNGDKFIRVKLSMGYYEDSGYGGLSDARFYITQKIKAGKYKLAGLAGFDFEAYYYESDTQGTRAHSFVTSLAEANYISDAILTIKKSSFTAFTEEDIVNVESNFVAELIESNKGIVHDIDALNKSIDTLNKSKSLFVNRVPHSPTLASGEECSFIYVTRHFNSEYDLVTHFGNKFNTANANFDFYEEILTTRVGENVSESHSGTSIFGGDTDHIVGIVVAAKNNADGDFPTNTSLVTGGFHGYNAISTRDVTPTMREISKVVLVDGKTLTNGQSAYGDKCIILVKNRIQACNTEKEDGSGREVIEQRIRVEITNDKTDVFVDFIALEPCVFHSMAGFACYVPNAEVRFIGSKTHRGSYLANNAVVRTNSIASVLSATKNDHTINLSIDRNYGLGTYQENDYDDTTKAQITNVNKMYFRLLGDPHPVELDTNDMVSIHGSYDVVE